MKKTTIFLMLNLVLACSLPLKANYASDVFHAVSSTAHYVVLRTSESCKESGHYIKEKVQSMGSSIRQWWHAHKPSAPTVVVIKEN